MSRKTKSLHYNNKSAEAVNAALLKKEFLKAVSQGGALYYAAAKIGKSSDTIERWRKADPDFDAAVVEANNHVTDKLKRTAYTRAMKGKSKGADTLLMFLIKQRDPSFRENFRLNAQYMHAGMIANRTGVPHALQAVVDALDVDQVRKMVEKL